MSSILVPLVVMLVVVFAVAIYIDHRRRRLPDVPSSGDERARRAQSGADHRTGRP
jgi:hypothetical protein